MSIPAQGAVGAETMTAKPGDILFQSGWETKRPIPHEEAREIAARLIASHFRRTDCETARASIPANPDRDDDLLINAYIKQQARKEAALASPRADSDGRTADEGTEWFWRIVDANGLGNVPSDEGGALRLLCTKAARYDEMRATAAQPAGAVPDSLREVLLLARAALNAATDALDGAAKREKVPDRSLKLLSTSQDCVYAASAIRERLASHPAGQSAGSGAWAEHSPQEIVRRTRCMADETRDPVVWRDCCDLILERLGKPAPDSTRLGQGEENWKCPECGCRWFTRVNERKSDGEFGPGPNVRCDECKLVRHLPALAARPAAPEAQGAWLPISTAPKDGSEILLTDGSTVCAGFWDDAVGCRRADAGWFEECDRAALINAKNLAATHWQSMPAPPASSGQGGR